MLCASNWIQPIDPIVNHLRIDRYEPRKGHKGNHNHHQGYRGKKGDQVSSSVADDKYAKARSNRSNEKISSSEALAKDIEQASTIRPQGKHSN